MDQNRGFRIFFSKNKILSTTLMLVGGISLLSFFNTSENSFFTKNIKKEDTSTILLNSCNTMITNCEFELGTSDWNASTQSGSAATFSIDNSNQLSGTNSALINISSSSGTGWHVQLIQDQFNLVLGTTYNFSFQGMATGAKTISVNFQKRESPWTVYHSQTINLTTTATQYGTFSFVAPSNDSNVGIVFNLGTNAENVYLDDIQLYSSSTNISSQVSGSSDDAEEHLIDGSMDLTSSDLELITQLGTFPAVDTIQLVGMRFNNLTIPQGYFIEYAYIEFEVDETPTNATNLVIMGEDINNAPTFTNTVNNISNRTPTSATVPWNNIPIWTTVSAKKVTPNIAPIVQEIVDRAGWVSGNSMVMMVQGSGSRIVESYDGEAPNAPTLYISYSAMSVDAGADASFCEGDSTTLTATPSKGTPPITYVWDNGVGAGISHSVSPTATTIYGVTATDFNGAIAADLVTVTVNSNPIPNPSANTSICSGDTTTITVGASGGDGSYTYSWNNGLGAGNSHDVFPSTTTTYTVTVTDGNSCTGTAQTTVTVNPNPTVNAGANVSVCSGDSTTITAVGSGGTSPYTYEWDNSLGTDSSLSVAPTVLTTYTVTVTDSNGCIGTDQVTVSIYPDVIANAGVPDTICGGDSATLSASASGGDGSFSYIWSDGGATSHSVSPIVTTTYTVTVTDGNTCTSTAEVIITVTGLVMDIDAGADTSICSGDFVLISPITTGGSGTYTYLWDNGLGTDPSHLVNPSSTTIYNVTVSDAYGCTDTDQIQVTVNDLPILDAGAGDTLCIGGTTTLTASASGGGGGFNYVWNNGLGAGVSHSITPTTDSIYTVTVTDANGCSAVDSVFIKINTLPVANAGSDTTICNGNNITIAGSGSGGDGSYTYNWSGGLGAGSVQNINPSVTTTYTVTLTDGNGCTDTDEIIVTVDPLPTVNAGADVEICNGNNTTLTATASGGSGSGYTYVWDNGLGAGAAHLVTPSSTTFYHVTLTDGNGCIDVDTVLVTVNTLPIVDAGADEDFCFGENVTLAATASGGDGSYTYTWDNSLGAGDSHIVSPAVSTTYIVTVTDGNTCADIDTITLTPIIVSVNAGSDVSICLGDTTTLTAVGSGSDGFYSYAWSDGSGTGASVDASPNANTTYTVTVTDGAGCTSTDQVAVSIYSNPPVITPSADVSICNGENTSLSASSTGGIGLLTYTWSDGLGTGTPKVVNPTSTTIYSVIVADANGCKDTAQIQVTVNDVPTVSASVTSIFNGEDISCNGVSDGTAEATPSGAFPFTYSWSNGDAGPIATGLGAGTYTVTVTDANTCTVSTTVTLTAPTALSGSAVVTSNFNAAQISCYGASDGKAVVTPSGGTAPYTYVWNDPFDQVTDTVTNLSAGTYTVTISDVNGCTATTSVSISQPAQLTVSISKNDATCIDDNDGDATATPSDGTSPYTYAWSSGGSAALENNLIAGIYTVTVTDGNGCTAFAESTIGESSALAISTSSADASCAANNDGSITVTASGATSYSYAWSSSAGTAPTEGSLSAGTYTVTVTDNFGCTLSETVNISAVSNIASTISGTQINCYGGNDGTATVTPVGGVPTYNYNWSDAAINSATRTGLAAGTYTVTITDANSCQVINSITLTQPFALAFSSDSTAATCNGGSDGSVTANITGGTFPYTYAWSVAGSTSTISGLSAGTYTVTATDDNGCTISQSITVNEPTVVTASFSNNNISCNGFDDGTSTVTPSGGTTPYSYLWSNGSNAATANSLSPTTHTVTITDGNGCVYSFNTLLTEPATLVASASITSTYAGFNISCKGYNDGTATASAVGGTTSYTYAWSNGQTNANLINATAGTYTVTITDDNNCTASASVNFIEPSGITLSASVTSDYNGLDISCDGATDGTGIVVVAGGTGGYVYSWSNSATTADVSGLGENTYTVTVTDANNCTASETIVLQHDSLIISANVTSDYNGEEVSCVGASDGTVTAIGADGSGGYLYQWSTGATTALVTDLSAGTYTVTTTDSNGCTATASVTVDDPAALTVAPTVTSNFNAAQISCYGATDGSAAANVTGGVSPYSYQWSNSTNAASINSVGSGTYSVTVTDANGCTVMGNVSIIEPTELTVSTSINSSYNGLAISCSGGSDGAALATPSGGTVGGGYTYNWSSGHGVDNASGLNAGTYTVTVTDANGCTATSNITLTEPDGMIVDVTVITDFNGYDLSCPSGSDGGITSNPINGVAPYTYSWSNGSTTKTITGLSAGTYTVTVTDDNTCTNSASISISDPPAMTVVFSKQNHNGSEISCVGGNDGELEVSITNGDAPYQYSWSNGKKTKKVKKLSAGTYTVTITDKLGCTVTASSTLTDPTPLSVSTAITSSYLGNDISCHGGSDGTGLATPSGGSGTYRYAWSNGQTTAALTGASAETYFVTVTDANGCTATSTVSFSEPSQFSIEVTSTNLSDCDETDGIILITASGGIGTYEYKLDNGSWGSTNSFTGLGVGTYNVYVRNGLGTCESDAFTVSLELPETPVIGGIIEINPTTATANDGSILVNTSGNGSIIEYRIVSVTGWQYSNLFTGLDEGTYDVEVRYDGTDCIVSTSVTLVAGDGIIGNNTSTSLCSDDVSGQQALETYYIPGAEDQILTALETIIHSGCGSSTPQDPIYNYISIGVVEAGTYVYYDHWEDGYEINPFFPIQSSTEIWGDGDTTNGVPPGYTVDVLAASDNIILFDTVVTATRQAITDYDGGDKISSRGRLSLTRLAWADQTTVYLAGAVEVYPTNSWGDEFIVPVGENMSMHELFDYTGAIIMAKENNTTIDIDADGDGTFETTTFLDEGESYLISGGLDAGGNITSDKDIQMHLITGDVCGIYESRWFTLQPVDRWSSSYFNPVATPNDGTNTHSDFTNAPTYVHLYNPNIADITVNWETEAGTQTPIVVPANGTNYQELPDSTGTRFYDSAGNDFYAIATIDSDAWGNNGRNDWGFAMTPEGSLSGQITLVGFAPGGIPTITSSTENSSPIWVTTGYPQGDTNTSTIDICIDFNGDGGTYTDANGQGYDSLMTLAVLEQVKIYDADGDQTSMRIWVCDGSNALVSGVWGQDPVNVVTESDAMDLGVGLPNGVPFNATKCVDLIDDKNGNGLFEECDVVQYSIHIENTGVLPLSIGSLNILDTLPTGLTYVENSTTTFYLFGTNAVADDSSPSTPFPLDESGVSYNAIIAPGDSILITFNATINSLGASSFIRNVAYINGVNTTLEPEVTFLAQEPPIPEIPPIPPPDTTLSCDQAIPVAGYLDTLSMVYNEVQTPGSCPQEYVLDRTWTVTDYCGNVTVLQQIISVEDNVAPILDGVPIDVTVSPDSIPIAPTVNAFDNCDTLVIVGFSQLTNSALCNYAIERTWSATDDCGNTVSQTQTITVVSDINIDINIDLDYNGENVSCEGSSNGGVTANITGGTAPFGFAWSGGVGTGATRTGLSAGTYIVTVTDFTGCTISSSITITEPTAVAATASVISNYNGSQVSCVGASDGIITASGSGGVLGYTYTWSGGIGTGATKTGLAAGTYTVTVTDANTCTATSEVTISDPTAIDPNASVTSNYNGQEVSCIGSSDGTATASATGGTGSYTFVWSNGSITANTSGLSAGTYTVTISDGNSCTASATVTVNDPPALSVSTNKTSDHNGEDISCVGVNDGAADASAAGGSGGYTYTWSNGQTGVDLTNVVTGTYTVTATDNNGCTATNTITLNDPTDVTVSLSITSVHNGQQISCVGASDGAINSTVSNGTPGYTYAWDGGQTTPNISGISAGTYTLIVTDVNGCTTSDSIVINNPLPLNTSISITSDFNGEDVSCVGASDGSVRANVVGGTSGYTYAWSGGLGTGATKTGLTVGTYTVTVTDANTCTSSTTITLNAPTALTLSTSISQNTSCVGATDGSATSSPSGGTLPSGTYIYTWSNGQSNSTLVNVGAGTYTLTITDDNGCTSTSSITFTDPSPITISASVTSNYNGSQVNCYEDSDGTASASASGGTGTLDYLWSNGQTGTGVTGLSAGTYIVVVTDDNGCTASASVSVIEPLPVVADAGVGETICNGESSNLTASASGGTPIAVVGYTYAWSGGLGSGASKTVSPITTTTYTVTITDANSCTDTDQITISVNNTPTVTASADVTICNGEDTTISVSASGTSGYSYVWSNGLGTGSSKLITPTSTTTYTVTVTDINGCTDEDQVIVTVSDPIAVITSNTPICPGNDINLSVTAADSYSWTGPNGFTSSIQSPVINTATLADSGVYYVTITDVAGCTSTAVTNFVMLLCAEDCTNGVDDDGDDDVDCDDSDCAPAASNAVLNTCDNSNNTGTGTFFLHDANSTVSTASGVMISYHPTLADAQNDNNILTSPYNSSNATVYARVEIISTGCYATSTITLNVGAKCAENCNNGIDEDGDGLIDCDDPDCPCCDSYAPTLNNANKNRP